MTRYFVKLRYYPGDPLEEIKEEDLKGLEKVYGVKIDFQRIEKREMKKGFLVEETLDKPLEDISQDIITVSSDQEDNFSDCIIALYQKYRSPRTIYSFFGSNEPGRKIAKRFMDVHGGW